MTYFYIHPLKPQYFFPEGFENDPIFRSFFQPYSFRGQLSWNLFCSSRIYRQFFKKEDISKYIPEEKIRNILNSQCPMAFNKGTLGPEQKITALGKHNGEYFFIKYGQTPLARKNVAHEYEILKQLEKKVDFAPTPQNYHEDEQQVLLQTEVLKGKRKKSTELDDTMLDILFQLPEVDINVQKITDSDLRQVFAHGDFCPWNMMQTNKKIKLFDWEMGGIYPLGYDLFTFIFQTSFLLTPEKPLDEITALHEYYIDHYFNHFGIQEWDSYLFEFARIKAELEKNKDDEGLYNQYKKLRQYA